MRTKSWNLPRVYPCRNLAGQAQRANANLDALTKGAPIGDNGTSLTFIIFMTGFLLNLLLQCEVAGKHPSVE
jgi:hypothetical protein